MGHYVCEEMSIARLIFSPPSQAQFLLLHTKSGFTGLSTDSFPFGTDSDQAWDAVLHIFLFIFGRFFFPESIRVYFGLGQQQY